MLEFTGERIVPGAANCEPNFAEKMYVEHSARYRLAAQLAAGARVLDVGCGVGYGAQLLAQAGAREVVAFDLSPEAVTHARENFAHPAACFEVGNAMDFACFGGGFDLVTCFELIEHVPDQEATLRCIAAALAPEGVLVVSTPRRLTQPRNEFHEHEYEPEEFREALSRHFRHHRLMVENNHLCSLVTDTTAPQALDRIFRLNDQFGLDQADYMIGLATHGNPARLAQLRPVLVMGSEAYVKLLERDNGILQRRRVQLEGEVAELRRAAQAAEVAKDAAMAEVRAMRNSISWRMIARLRRGSHVLAKAFWPYGRAIEFRSRFRGRAMVRRAAKVALGRLTGQPEHQRPWIGPQPEVLFFVGCWEGEYKRYRVQNVAEALRQGGRRVEVMPFSSLHRVAEQGILPAVVVIFRAPDEASVGPYLRYARRNGIRTLFDVDDLVFEPNLVEQVHGYKMLSEPGKAEYRDGVVRYRALLCKCDGAIVSTAPLAEAVAALGLPVRVVPNTWNDIQDRLAEKLLATPRLAREEVVIGYFSGSRTHDRDFVEAAPALLRLMREDARVRMRIVGELDPGPAFAALEGRVEWHDLVPYDDMLRLLRDCDLVIAPLEPDNCFNEAKSELKWFEAALVEVPCVASPTAVFRAAIRHGETGFLATDEASWHAALAALVADTALRARVGAAARVAAREGFGPEALRRAAEAALALPTPAAPAVLASPGRKRIDWIVPGLIIGGGGHRNILRAAHFLERFGHDVGLVFTNIEHSADTLRGLLHQHFYPFDGMIRPYDGVFRSSDAIIATHWTTVEPALRARGLTQEVMYFVQDFEPLFAPMGTEYILAESTYRKGLYCITSGPWCKMMLMRDFGAEADHFEFPIDRDVYFPRDRTKPELNVLYFAKPEMPRRCYELGVMMLSELHRLMPELEILLYGSRNVDLGALGFPATRLGLLPTIHDLAQAYANADLGIAFSTTNPSLVPYEMMACGTAVVDLGRPGNEVNYGGRFDVALLADPDPARMARQVRDLLRNPAQRAARAKAGLELVARMPTEEQMARRVEELILRRLAR